VRGLVARYSPTGHLVWVTADGSLNAQRFDLDRLELTGDAVTLWSGVAIGGFGAVDLALSAAGDLAYTMGAENESTVELVWVARDGSTMRVDTTADQGFIASLALAPDGRAAALEALRSSGAASNLTRIWVKRLGGGPTELVTSENSNSRNPAWGSSSRDLFYSSLGGEVVMRRRADGSGTPELVLREPRGVEELAVSPDGGTLLLRTGTDGAGRGDLLQFRIGIDSAAVPLLATPAHEEGPAISPDGRWLAYASDESGGLQVYVRPFPDVNAQRVQISVDGGAEPRWNPAADEIFYLNAAGDVMSARVRTSPAFGVLRVDRLFNASGFLSDGAYPIYDVGRDGQRFLMLDIPVTRGGDGTGRLVLVHNFANELNRRLPQ
jgi:serine/threonine-protein kinase